MDVKAVTFSGGGEPLIYSHIAQTIEALGRGALKSELYLMGFFYGTK
jgi:wyosine [tRNA(Phe)-imidazoG37] synthetase (radical SAM superfamily)